MLAQIVSIQLFWAAEDSQEYVEQINVISLVYWGVMVMCSTYSCTLHMNRKLREAPISLILLLINRIRKGSIWSRNALSASADRLGTPLRPVKFPGEDL